MTEVRRGQVFLIAVDPTTGSEIRKSRPGLVVSPDELNRHSETVMIAPMTTGSHQYPFRVPCEFDGTSGHVVMDQIHAVATARLLKRLGALDPETVSATLAVLREMFAD